MANNGQPKNTRLAWHEQTPTNVVETVKRGFVLLVLCNGERVEAWLGGNPVRPDVIRTLLQRRMICPSGPPHIDGPVPHTYTHPESVELPDLDA